MLWNLVILFTLTDCIGQTSVEKAKTVIQQFVLKANVAKYTYTQQKRKCHTFVFAPIFHELK